MGARQEDLRAAGLAAHVVDVGAHAVARAEGLARQQLVAAQDRLGAAEVDRDVAELDALDQAVDDLADAVLVLVELASGLRRCASARVMWVASFSIVSTTSRNRLRRMSPLARSISARMSCSAPYFERPAF
jgi:hypothetical protein